MGEARRRGTREDRIAKAIERIEALRPAFIVCNGCAAELRDVFPLEIESAPGLDAVHYARCEACDAETLAAQGTPEALRVLADHLRSRTEIKDMVGGRYTTTS
ncbi:MAG: hypothetical protein H5U40_07900 [Polyangiaceae bacterium]|nr:hypothetical protein [Polyangiaceae bacterium]